MALTRVSPRFTLKIPAQYRDLLRAGRNVAIEPDDQGRLIITPVESHHAALQATFGLWAGRDDMPGDACAAADELRANPGA
jgi:hypothetical protein